MADKEQRAIDVIEVIETLHPRLAESQHKAQPGRAADMETTVKEFLAGKETPDQLLLSCDAVGDAADNVEKAAMLLEALRQEQKVS